MAQSANVRDFILTSKDRFRRELVEIPGPNGQSFKVLIKEPSIRQRGEIFKAATKIKRNQEPEVDHAELQVWAVICCVCDPETEQPLFEPAHKDTLLSLPASIFDLLAKPALSMIGEEPEEIAGNS